MPNGAAVHSSQIPDYPENLAAMASAEKVLTEDTQERDYAQWLFKLTTGFDYSPADIFARDIFKCARATAPQRAEAFLRTIGEWKET